jgi:uncharacterized protein YecE (DUF72 family)
MRGPEMLGYYARAFRVVELNTTYYGMPKPAAMERMAQRVPPGFEFTVKANRDMTHGERLLPEAFAEFREAMQPLQERGMLGCVLAQFPHGFRRTRGNEAYVEAVREELSGMPLVIEFRNSDWVSEATFDWLRELSVGFCCVDEPQLTGLMPPVAEVTSPVGYVRFHGRNREKWHRHETVEERYNYLYTPEELAEWTPRIAGVAARAEKTYVFFNNCYSDYALRNARDMAALLDLELPNIAPAQGTLDF